MDICITKVVDGEELPCWTQKFIAYPAWEELFIGTLGVGPTEPGREGEGFLDFEDRRRETFRRALASHGLLMLGRIDDIYTDAFFSPDEVAELLEELNRVEPIAVGEMAKGIITNLKTAAEEALSNGRGIALIAD